MQGECACRVCVCVGGKGVRVCVGVCTPSVVCEGVCVCMCIGCVCVWGGAHLVCVMCRGSVHVGGVGVCAHRVLCVGGCVCSCV